MRPRRIAVLGAGGFLGSHLVPALLRRFDCSVDALDLDFERLPPGDFRLHRVLGRVEDAALLERVTERADLVLSLTALCNPALYSTVPLAVIDANFTHLLPLVERCAQRGTRLIHFSTAEVYGLHATDGSGRATRQMSEDDACSLLGPVHEERWTYACAKQLLERVIWAHGEHGRLPFTIIRPFNTIGARMDYLPGVDGEGTPRVLACFMNALLRAEPLPLVSGGNQRRAFMCVSDMVEAVCRVVERPEQTRGQILNLGNPHNELSIAELGARLADAFARALPEAPPARFESVSALDFYGPGYADTFQRIPDIRKARRLLGWHPQVSLDQMLPGIVSDYVARYAGRIGGARAARVSVA